MLTNIKLKSKTTPNYILITYDIIQVLVDFKWVERQEKHSYIF